VINLNEVTMTIVDTTVPGVMEGWNWRARVYETRASEVLIDTWVIPDAIKNVILP
jgi:hypothetical protein